jgi:SAM-dependent methyltransferase
MNDQARAEGRESDQPRTAGRETETETAERLRHGSSFGAAAAAYAEHRPVYAEAGVEWVLEPVRDRRPLRVADIGAGTGKLTAMLARLGADVTAVEPDPEMLAELRRAMPSVRSEPGSAEALPLADASVDAVLAGQAMHWFDLDRALPEIARVLTPGGVLAGLWNVDDDRVGWVADLSVISRRKSSPTLLRWRAGADRGRPAALAEVAADLFRPAEEGEFEHGQARTAGSLTATIGTHSHLLTMEEAERSALLARIRGFLDSRPETSHGEFTLPLVTMALRMVRR